ncbi:MAG: hypothetical protein ACK5JT_08140 [Hyphomicrobiaceae bacterium]
MTRTRLKKTLRWSYLWLGLVLAVALLFRLTNFIPGVAGTTAEQIFTSIYDYLKDMSLVFITVVATYLAGVYQKRQGFIDALKMEWREIVRAKSELVVYTQLENPARDDYMRAFLAISETLDNMRTVYANVGETSELIGLYPFAPLHDMRRALQTLDPAKVREVSPEHRRLARDAILQTFYALRESFLEELDLEEPDSPIIAWGSRRHKKSGAPAWARKRQQDEQRETDAANPPDPRIQAFLQLLHDHEHRTVKPWRGASVTNGQTPPPPPVSLRGDLT